MWTALEKATDVYIKTLFIEGERYLKIQGWIISFEILKKLRRLFILVLGIHFIFLVLLGSIFATTQHLFNLYNQFDFIPFDLQLVFYISLILVSSLTFYLLIREKSWIWALGFNKTLIYNPEDFNKFNKSSKDSNSLSEEDLLKITEVFKDLLDKKLKDLS